MKPKTLLSGTLYVLNKNPKQTIHCRVDQTDNLISGQRSVVPFSKVECDDLGKVLKELSGTPIVEFTIPPSTLMPIDPSYDASPARTVFVAWFLREVCSFRDSEHYGSHTLKQSEALRQELKPSSSPISRPPAFLLPLVNLVIRVVFFGIPFIYLSHVRKSSEYRGRLANIQQNWDNYIERLVREYAHFLLIVSYSAFLSALSLIHPQVNRSPFVGLSIQVLSSFSTKFQGHRGASVRFGLPTACQKRRNRVRPRVSGQYTRRRGRNLATSSQYPYC
jgi:hypothetical protein